MSALDSAAVIIEYADLYVGDDSSSLVNIGALRNLKFMAKPIETKIESDNRGTILTKMRLNGEVTADLLEPGNVGTLDSLFKGVLTKSTTAGSLVSGATVVKASGAWSYNVPFTLTGQNATGLKQSITSVVSATNGALVANVDYVQVQLADGTWGIQIIDSTTVTTAAQTVTVTYDYTPATAWVLTGGTNQTATKRYVRIVAPSEDSALVTRQIDLSGADVTSDLLLAFVDVEQANDVGVMPVTFVNRKGETWTMTDQINPS